MNSLNPRVGFGFLKLHDDNAGVFAALNRKP